MRAAHFSERLALQSPRTTHILMCGFACLIPTDCGVFSWVQMQLVEALGLVVKGRRRALNITQEQLAEAASTHVNSVSLVERGLQNITLETLVAIAGALNISLSELFALAERLLVDEAGLRTARASESPE